MELSKRLEAVAELVTDGLRLADIGTDHGYIPIYLVEQKRIPSAIAMDINEGPLIRAKEHIQEHGLGNKIRTRKSDGLKDLDVNETDSMIAAGMGGALIIRILSDCPDTIASMQECILQPQSEIGKVRKYLIEHGYRIEEENMVYEEGKFYPMMKAIPGKREEIPYKEEEYEYGRCLLRMKHPVLQQFLERELGKKKEIYRRLLEKENPLPRIQKRIKELEQEIALLEKALHVYDSGKEE